MKKSQLKKLIKEEINFILGPSPGGDPDKPMEDSFYIQFKDPVNAERIIQQVNNQLESDGFEPIDYENIGIVFPNPTNQQMSAIIKAFDKNSISGMGRTDITGI